MSGSENDPGRLTYAGGYDAVLRQMEGRRDPFTFQDDEALPPGDCDLKSLRSEIVGALPVALKKSKSTFGYKCRELNEEFYGRPRLCYLNGLLIANLRRRDQPPQCAPLFRRIWAEEHAFMLSQLDARWLVSSVTTFADHGATEAQRRVGHALTVLFSTMKLYETERLFSGHAPDEPFPWRRKTSNALPLQMDPYAVTGGGLDVNMLGRLWDDAAGDEVIAPLAHHLLRALNADGRNVFRRLRLMREARQEGRAAPAPGVDFERDPQFDRHAVPVPGALAKAPPSWGVVATVKAPLDQIARFAAWHRELGAERVTLYLDAPETAQTGWLAGRDWLQVIPCDEAHWTRLGRRPKMHQLRQAANAQDAYDHARTAWLAHVDVDEFLLPAGPLSDVLAAAPGEAALVHLHPVEMLAEPAPSDTRRFKTTARMAGQHKRVLQRLYPTFGGHLRGGYVSHLEGKVIARTGLAGVSPGIHFLNWKGKPATNRVIPQGSYVGHAHAPDFDSFMAHLPYRMHHGSYRKRENTDFRLADVIDFLQQQEGPGALAGFFEEVCTATPRLVADLDKSGMLVTREMPFDALVAKHFGGPPPEGA